MSEKKFDFKNLYQHGHFPHLKIVVDVATEQLDDGEPMEKVLQESLEFVVSQAANLQTELVVNANKQVAEGLEKLALQDAWPNLGRAAEHALELKEATLKREGRKHLDDLIKFTSLKRKVVNSCIPELLDMFRREWLEMNYPELLKEDD